MYYKSGIENVLVVGLTVITIWTSNIAQVLSCWGSASTNIGVMTPDQTLLDGNRLLMECSLNNKTISYENNIYSVNSSMLSIKFNKQFYSNDKIHVINSTAVQLVVDKASSVDTGMYLCMLNISGLDHHPLVCVTHITVGYKPQRVTEFKCISMYYRKLHCSWTPVYNAVSTSYVLEDKIHPNSTLDYLSRRCGNVPTENSCEWAIDTVPPYRNTALEFNFVLTGRNQFGTNSELFVVNHYSIIKPNIPKNFKKLEVNTNNISLSWSPPEYIEFDEDLLENIVYEIRYFGSTPHDSNQYKSQTVIIDGIHKTSHVLTDLFPYISYNISIRCKTIQSQSDQFWSEFSSLLITTKSDVPYLAPELIPESFQTDKNMEGMRSITLFWRHIPVEYRNGNDFRYAIEFRERSNQRSKTSSNRLDNGFNEPNESRNTFYTFNHMKSDIAYTFRIYGVNHLGVSLNYSQITVERNDIIPHKPKNIDVYAFGGGRYEVQFSAPRVNSMSGSVSNYTVFWCQNLKPRPFPCQGAINWVTTNNMSIALELPDIGINYQFAVSANSLSGISSGISWAECIVPIDGRLDKLSEIHSKIINSTSAVVSWKLGCPAQKRVVEGFKIKFCEFPECSEEQNVMVDNLVESYVLNGLKPFSKYKITVLAWSSDTGPSEESDPQFIQTHADAPEDSPSGLKLQNITTDSITLWWRPPMKPNGRVSHYEVECNQIIHSFDADKCTENGCLATIGSLDSFKSYDIKVKACTGSSLCSPETVLKSQTLASEPRRLDPPRSEVINSTSIRISWSPPLAPNGPIDYYTLRLIRTDNTTERFNISGKQNQYFLSIDCDSSVGPNAVQISATNTVNDWDLMSEYSESTSLNACLFVDQNIGYIIGLIAGGTLGLMSFVMVLAALVRWMKQRIVNYKNLRIELPPGLQVPQLVTDSYDRDNSDIFCPFVRTDSTPDMTSGMILPVSDDFELFKDRHGSGVSHTSNSSTEGLIYKNQTNDSFFRMVSNDSGQHESGLSHVSGAEAHISSDSGVEIDSHQIIIGLLNDSKPKMCSIPPLPKVDELCSRNSDSSGDSGLDIPNGIQSKRKRKPKNIKSNPKISSIVMPTHRNEVMNPLYDSPLNHSVCIYSLLANSEPSLFEVPIREDDNILSSHTTKFTKPEMAKSLTNIIQSCSTSDPKVNCIICENNNNSSRGSTRTTSPNCPYYKYGIKRQNHLQTNCLTNFSPEKKLQTNVTKTNNGYITIESLYESEHSVHPKKRLEHDWSQNSYDAEVSSTSSNGDNEQTDPLPQTHPPLPQSRNECKKIQNISSIEDNTEVNDICQSFVNPLNPSKDNVIECETQFNVPKESSKSSPTRVLAKDSNGYVLHNALTQLSVNHMKPKLIKHSNGYVVIDGNGIEMNDLVPNHNNVSHVTQV